MGRPSTLTAVKQMLGGHYRVVNESEPRASGTGKCPRSLSKEARAHWHRLAKVLRPLGLLSPADVDAFGILCRALARLDRAEAKIAKSGGSEIVVLRGKPISHPWVRVRTEAEATAQRMFLHFGLTPSARCQLFASANAPIPVTPDKHDVDVAESFFDSSESSVN